MSDVGDAPSRLWLRPASLSDAADVYRWRYGTEAWRFYRSSSKPEFQEHLDWFARALASDRQHLLIGEFSGRPAVHIRLDMVSDERGVAEISVCVDDRLRGLGLGRRAINAGCRYAAEIGCNRVTAQVHAHNAASRALFHRCDFRCVRIEGAFERYERAL